MGKLSLVGYTPPLPEVIEAKEPALTPAVVVVLFGDIFKRLYLSKDHRPKFESVDNETSVRGNVSFDQAKLVELAVVEFNGLAEGRGRQVPEGDHAKVSRGLNLWLKEGHAARSDRRRVAKEAALAALPQAAE
jgi:hypothetical protein